MNLERPPSSNVFVRLLLERLRGEFGERWQHERDVERLDRLMASMRIDFPRLLADRELRKMVAALVFQPPAWVLSVAAERGFPNPTGLAYSRARDKRRPRRESPNP